MEIRSIFNLQCNDSIVALAKECKLFVEATSFEHQCLWEKYHDRYEWQQLNGTIFKCGTMNGRAVTLDIRFARVGGELVMFFYPCGMLADWTVIGEWFSKDFGDNRLVLTDANNFHNILHKVQKKGE